MLLNVIISGVLSYTGSNIFYSDKIPEFLYQVFMLSTKYIFFPSLTMEKYTRLLYIYLK